jgi:hypothetical protein
MNHACKELFHWCKNHSIKGKFKFDNPVAASYDFHPILTQRFQNGRKGRGTQPLQAKMSKYFQIVLTKKVLAKGYQAASGLSNSIVNTSVQG